MPEPKKTITADDAEQLARVLRALYILKRGQTLHIGGHAIKVSR